MIAALLLAFQAGVRAVEGLSASAAVGCAFEVVIAQLPDLPQEVIGALAVQVRVTNKVVATRLDAVRVETARIPNALSHL